MSKNDPAERTVRDIRRKTRKQYTAEEKIRIVVSGLRRGEHRRLVRREGKGLQLVGFLEAGKISPATPGARRPRARLKFCAARPEGAGRRSLENRLLKKNMIGHGGDEE